MHFWKMRKLDGICQSAKCLFSLAKSHWRISITTTEGCSHQRQRVEAHWEPTFFVKAAANLSSYRMNPRNLNFASKVLLQHKNLHVFCSFRAKNHVFQHRFDTGLEEIIFPCTAWFGPQHPYLLSSSEAIGCNIPTQLTETPRELDVLGPSTSNAYCEHFCSSPGRQPNWNCRAAWGNGIELGGPTARSITTQTPFSQMAPDTVKPPKHSLWGIKLGIEGMMSLQDSVYLNKRRPRFCQSWFKTNENLYSTSVGDWGHITEVINIWWLDTVHHSNLNISTLGGNNSWARKMLFQPLLDLGAPSCMKVTHTLVPAGLQDPGKDLVKQHGLADFLFDLEPPSLRDTDLFAVWGHPHGQYHRGWLLTSDHGPDLNGNILKTLAQQPCWGSQQSELLRPFLLLWEPLRRVSYYLMKTAVMKIHRSWSQPLNTRESELNLPQRLTD